MGRLTVPETLVTFHAPDWVAATVPSTVRLPPLSSTDTTPVESLASVTRSAAASVPPPVVDSGAGTLSTSTSPMLLVPAGMAAARDTLPSTVMDPAPSSMLSVEPLSSTDRTPVELLAIVTRSAPASVPPPVTARVPVSASMVLSSPSTPSRWPMIVVCAADVAAPVGSVDEETVTSLLAPRLTSRPSASPVMGTALPSAETASLTIWTWPAAPASSVATSMPTAGVARVSLWNVTPSATVAPPV